MTQFNLYVHGVPVGHEICGCDDEPDYIKGFYNHDAEVKVASLLQIDIVNGKSFYTYLRKRNVRNAEGRPGSYFGLTVSFPKHYCANVQMLYEILDTIYRKLCVGILIKSDADGERFLVKDIAASRYESYPTVDYIKAVFQKNMESLRFNGLDGFANSTGEARFSLKEVDSPLFCDTLKNRRILVSPEYATVGYAYDRLLKEVAPVKDENTRMKCAVAQLEEGNKELSSEVRKLQNELASASADTNRKYKDKLEKLQKELDDCKKREAKLATKMKEAADAVDLMDVPMKTLIRLMAGRFQEDDAKGGQEIAEARRPGRPKDWRKAWSLSLVIVLLFGILVVCGFGWHAVSRLSENVAMMQAKLNERPATETAPADTASVEATGTGQNQIEEAKYEEYWIDIPELSQNSKLEKGRTYTLKVLKKRDGKAANVPQGHWEATEGMITITGNSFTVNNDVASKTNVQIHYTVNRKHEITRTLTVE